MAAALNRLSLIAELRRTSLCYEYEKIVFIHIIIHIDDRNRNKFKQITNSRKSVCGRSCHAIHLGGEGQIPTSPTRVRRTQSHYIQKLNSMKCVFIMFIFNHIIFLFNQRHVSS